jgi:hypothetical protein
MSKFESGAAEQGVNQSNGVISKIHIKKALFARVTKNKKMLAFSCEEHRDSR